jgi:GH24 family phage-related lysozyme (muramidase)
MAINTTLYSSNPSTFMDKLFDIITMLEQGRAFNGNVHNDGVNVPTIGYGYAMIVNGSSGWTIKPFLIGDLPQIGIALTAGQASTLRSIAAALNGGQPANAAALINTLAQSFPTVTMTQGRTLFDLEGARALSAIESQFSANLRSSAAGLALFTALSGTREMLALTSLAYNGPGTIGPQLTTALNTGRRADAWFEIRYESNPPPKPGQPNVQNGIAKRRYFESELFGLYDNTAIMDAVTCSPV